MHEGLNDILMADSSSYSHQNWTTCATLASMDLNKLTVPQLKALCKEKKLTGYSKLNKPALIAKLQGVTVRVEGEGTNAATNSAPTASTASFPRAGGSLGDTGHHGTNAVLAPVIVIRSDVTQLERTGDSGAASRTESTATQQLKGKPSFRREVSTRGSGTALESPQILSSVVRYRCDDIAQDARPTSFAANIEQRQVSGNVTNLRPPPPASSKRKRAPSSENPNAKRPKEFTLNTHDARVTKMPKPNTLVPKEHPARLKTHPPADKAIPDSILKETQALPSAPAVAPSKPTVLPIGKRAKFTPLIPKVPPSKLPGPPPASHGSEAARPLARPQTEAIMSPANGSSGNIPLDQFLNLPPFSDAFPTPQSISLPPSISQRRKVPKLSMVFSLLFREDLMVLGKLCRLYRYSGIFSVS
jgi:hypothetical protein